MKPFRFGASVAAARTAREWQEVARRVEGAGYATLLVPDHYVAPFAPMPALMAAASAAPSLRVGTMVAVNEFRHPAMLAKEAATIDFLTDGRFELGIGAGWHGAEFAATGTELLPGGERVERVGEAIAVIDGLWRAGPFTFHGDHYWIDALEGWPKPVQRPRPPVMVGGTGHALLSVAARAADIVSIAPSFASGLESFTAAGVEKRVGWIADAARERSEQVELSLYYAGRGAITDDREAAAERSLRAIAARAGASPLRLDEVLSSPQFLYGTVERIVDELVERRERYGVSYIVVTDEMVEPFEPVVRALAGVAV